ncbi:MAG TPA: hypothetical protein PLQ11_06040, partial [Beijerinckiaceae bacterium]|nr:hypothetical protein [Beijerinckiaceae bacterium]
MIDVTDDKALQAWLKKQPLEIVWLIGARAAWRVWPGLYYSYNQLNEIAATAIVLPLFRGSASAPVASTCPTSADGRRAAAAAVAEAA